MGANILIYKSSNKSKAARSSCFFCCFNTDRSTVSHDSRNSKISPAAAAVAVTADGRVKSKATCFCWFWIQRKKKRLLEQQINNPSPVPSYMARNLNATKVKVNRSKSLPAEQRRKLAADDGLISAEFQRPLLRQLTPKYDTRSRAETPNFPPEPVLGRRNHNQLGPNRPAAVTLRVNSPARMKRGKKHGPDVSLTVLGVTLAVTVFYGRSAAVVSLCACLYLVAFFRRPTLARKKMDRIAGAGHVGPREYRRKVVKEGFQERGNKNATRIVHALER
ncbi:hypothetical protein KSP40_PGU021612 [Platanthera guangdongensis]|uniref:Uncharacterized protein n=1 Tax=Platanthera guangdongensis TaxID=2320717 RepID=A0ABR2M502_9ASPA